MNGTRQDAHSGSIVHIPANVVHVVEIIEQETELLDVYDVRENADELRKQYPAET